MSPDKYAKYLAVARTFADMSAYKGTHVGAVVLGQGMQVLSTGWNGAPRGSLADGDDRSEPRDERLRWVTHAEANAIANAARSGVSLFGSTLVCTHAPCLSCAGLIVQSGIRQVLTPAADSRFKEFWGASVVDSIRLFEECGVDFREIPT